MKPRIFGTALPVLLLISAPAAAQVASPNAFVYNMKLSSGQRGMDISLAFTVTATDSDGNRKAVAVVRAPKMVPLDGKKFDVTVDRAGVITVGSTGTFTTGGAAEAKANSAAAIGPLLQMMINPLNVFAAGCAAAPSQKVGTTWHAYSSAVMTDVVFTITGREQQGGHNTIAVTMSSPGSGASVTGKGNYDPAARVVVNVHSEVRQAAGARELK